MIPRAVAAALLAAALPRIALGLEVTVVVRGPAPAKPVHVRVLKEPMDGTAAASEGREVSVEVSGQERAELAIDKARRWRVRAQAEGFWSEEKVVEAGVNRTLN